MRRGRCSAANAPLQIRHWTYNRYTNRTSIGVIDVRRLPGRHG